MRITKNQLRQIIKEELVKTLEEEGMISSLVQKGKEFFGGGEPDTIEKYEADKAEHTRAVGAGEIKSRDGFRQLKDLNARGKKLGVVKPTKAFSTDTSGMFPGLGR